MTNGRCVSASRAVVAAAERREQPAVDRIAVRQWREGQQTIPRRQRPLKTVDNPLLLKSSLMLVVRSHASLSLAVERNDPLPFAPNDRVCALHLGGTRSRDIALTPTKRHRHRIALRQSCSNSTHSRAAATVGDATTGGGPTPRFVRPL